MSDNNTNTEVPTLAAAIPSVLSLSREEIMTRVQTYKANAENSLQRIKENEAKLVEQLNKLQQMRLMVLGQLELTNDLIGAATAPAATPTATA